MKKIFLVLLLICLWMPIGVFAADCTDSQINRFKKLANEIQTTFDTITIHGKSGYALDDIPIINSHNDHRIVMAMCVFGLCANTPCIIENAQAITKSYPDFFEDIQRIGGKVEFL